MAYSLKKITSIAAAHELGLVETAAFAASSLTNALYPIHTNRLAMEKWFIEREKLSLEDLTQVTIARVTTAITDDEAGAGATRFAGVTTATGNAGEKTVSWMRVRLPKVRLRDEKGDVRGWTAEQEADLKARKEKLITSQEGVPPGTNVKFSDAFRAGLWEGRKKWFDEERDYAIEVLLTHPDHERRGHGRTLLNWAMQRADEEGARIFLEATAAGKPLYEKLGWREVDRLVWRLADYGAEQWGEQQVITLMIREPSCAAGEEKN
ncbi:hypothetical protein AJ80_05481 [Polytolypa hystricis UAMH7299]|uniref:N-acetyltransferase domain-containing protein n=1 Tax=Polytolypa hystricis (strain UAMH7299) TaxID=1447883 RepID=A0A2B7Y2B0_POLH7|nr:hypothetical protein AJ80_05481 [Polytolypa hystricis UAMH7299]